MDLFLVAVIWLFTFYVLFSKYFKLSDNEKTKFKEELKQPNVIFTDIFRILGFLFLYSGLIYRKFLSEIGVVLVCIALFVTGIEMYESKKKASVMIIAASIIFPFVYFQL